MWPPPSPFPIIHINTLIISHRSNYNQAHFKQCIDVKVIAAKLDKFSWLYMWVYLLACDKAINWFELEELGVMLSPVLASYLPGSWPWRQEGEISVNVLICTEYINNGRSHNVLICIEYINNGRSPMSRLCTENAYNGLNIFFSFHDTIYSKTITLFTWMFKLKRIRILEGCINSTCTSLKYIIYLAMHSIFDCSRQYFRHVACFIFIRR